ncbi:MAG: HAD family hydrolase [Pirellulales bacterium]|nr:HAD family hydrolase [Pirellulales bacterium]
MAESSVSHPAIEILRPDFPRGEFRAVLFDFDGTLSLIRRNWQAVMIPMMVEVLAETGTGETPDELHAHVEEFVMRLNGRQTIYQMIQLAEEVQARGRTPLDPLAYKHEYHERLWKQVGARVDGLRSGTLSIDEATVPNSHALLQALTDRGLELYLASGTDLKYVREEAELLDVARFFGQHIYGALDNYQDFSKQKIIDQIIHEAGVPGHQLLGFGDGFVEIEEVRRAGGVAIGVASEEETRQGVNAWKRERLIRAGADIIIGDYRSLDELLATLGLAG